MDFLYSFFFAAGASGFIYSKMEKRIGYGNTSSVWQVTGVVFVLSLIIFYTILKFILNV